MPGRMFREAYEKEGLAPVNLSRALEDGGTITSPLIPWNTCGAYMQSVLLVPVTDYLFFAFFNLINPLVSIVYGFTGFTMVRIDEADDVAAFLTHENNNKTLLVSGDKDWYQLMTKDTCVLKKSREHTYEQIEKQEGFPPERFAIYTLIKRQYQRH